MDHQTIRIAVAGAKGRMGQEVVKMVMQTDSFSFVAGIDSRIQGEDVGERIGIGHIGVPFYNSLEQAINETQPHVLVDFTTPETVKKNIETALNHGVRPVVGTTGLSSSDLDELDKLCREQKIGCVIAPNFAIGAILMMKFATVAARYMPHVEIIEMHHDQKLDAPSGTAMKTAELISGVREEIKQGHPEEKEVVDGSRGGYYQGFRIHSVRLPGLVAHQELIFGGSGQTLTIRHDSINRESFMPGVRLAVEKVMGLEELVYGMEHLIEG